MNRGRCQLTALAEGLTDEQGYWYWQAFLAALIPAYRASNADPVGALAISCSQRPAGAYAISHSTSMMACFGSFSSSAFATTLTGWAAGLTSSGSAKVLVARMS